MSISQQERQRTSSVSSVCPIYSGFTAFYSQSGLGFSVQASDGTCAFVSYRGRGKIKRERSSAGSG